MMQERGGYRPAYQRAGDGVRRLRDHELRMRGEEAGRRLLAPRAHAAGKIEAEDDLRDEAPVLSMVIGTLLLALLFNASVEFMFH